MAALRAALALACAASAYAWGSSHTCGVGHPDFAAEDAAATLVADQTYEAPGARALQTLQAQGYAGSGAFVPATAARAQNLTANLRITIMWDIVEFDDPSVKPIADIFTPRYQCPKECVSCQTANCPCDILVKRPAGSEGSDYVQGSNTSPQFYCNASHIVTGTAGATRYTQMKVRTTEAANYWSSTLQVTPVRDCITVNPDTGTPKFVFPTTTNLTKCDTDLVIIMTARPSPFSPIAGYASCIQTDQWGRCTVGHFNWVPELLNTGNTNGFDVIESERHTALHEIVHVLGGIGPGNPVFVNSTGFPITPGFSAGLCELNAITGTCTSPESTFLVEPDPAYPNYRTKRRTLVTTPRVVNFTQTYFNCPSAKGFPLEDVPLGAGSHWEARVAGPELMSYGAGSGQTYISDLTLGLLEDTNQYVADYSRAGFIVKPIFDDFVSSGAPSPLTASGEPGGLYVPPVPLRPGVPRWGYGEGCGFINGNPTQWPTAYLCTKNQDYTCTPDNRMSAVCVVISAYAALGTYATKPSCGEYQKGGVPNSCVYLNDNDKSLPSWAQFFPTDTAAAAAAGPLVSGTATKATTGGYNNAMDYVPVPVGYWNCQYEKPIDNKTVTSQGSLGYLSSLWGSKNDMDLFGGQSRCPTCRCIISSLVEISRGSLNPAFPKYGLCYRTNCVRPDYLQIAINGQLNGKAYWYRCPVSGGKMYIPGFIGAITCPPAEKFCAMETITGVKYAEESAIAGFVFWGIICGLAFLGFLAFAFPCLRERLITMFKKCSGARSFDPEGGVEGDGEDVPPLPRIPSWVLFATNILTMCMGLSIVGAVSYLMKVTRLYVICIGALGLGILIVFLSTCGIVASRKRANAGPSCWLLAYFSADIAFTLLLVWAVIYNLGFGNWNVYVDTYWDVVSDALGPSIPSISLAANATRADKVAAATVVVARNLNGVLGLAAVVIGIFFVALVASGCLLRARVVVALTVSLLNNLLVTLGLGFFAFGVYLYANSGYALGGITQVGGYMIGLGVLFAFLGGVGHCGVHRKSSPILGVYIVCNLAIMAITAAGCWLCFNRTAQVAAWIQSQNDSVLGQIASALGYSVDSAALITELVSSLNSLGLGIGLILGVEVVSVISTILFIWAARVWKAENGLSAAASAVLASSSSREAEVAKPQQHHHHHHHHPGKEVADMGATTSTHPRMTSAGYAV